MGKSLVPLVLVVLCGILLTLSGLLSKRVVLPQRSNQPPTPDAALVDQVVLVLVDAMRPDFVFPSLRRFASRGGLCSVDAPEQAGPTYNGPSLTYLEETLRRAEEGRSTDIAHLTSSGGTTPLRVMPPSDRPSAVGLFLVADAPTTTAQRLKALSTGVIPAFVEAGANFNSDEVSDDSLIVQARRLSASRVGTSPLPTPGGASVLGDDTWLSLFPKGLWKAAKVFSSFDVRDLDSNDQGVESYLGDLLEREAPSNPAASPLIIAHFLGVDHAGHRFNAQNEHMDRKITEIDASLRGLSATLTKRAQITKSNTMLLVLGDHGMTNSGDHGGNAPQETDTLLFAQLFSGRAPLSSLPNRQGSIGTAMRLLQNERRDLSCGRGDVDGDLCRLWACGDVAMSSRDDAGSSIPSVEGMGAAYQIDVVPTISTLLGMAIPFSNIGRVLPEVLSLAGGSEEDIASALLTNRNQMDTYLSATGNTHPIRGVDGVVVNRSSLIRDQARMASEVRSSRTHIKVHRIWIGVVGMLVFLLMVSIRALVSTPNLRSTKIAHVRGGGARSLWAVVVCCMSAFLLGCYTLGGQGNDQHEGIVLAALMLVIVMSASVADGVVTHRRVVHLWRHLTTSTKTAIPVAMVLSLVLIRMIVPLSNSFVVFEDRIIAWLLPLTLAALATVSTTPVSSSTWTRGIVLCVVLRLLSMSIRSRRHHTHVMDDLSPIDAWVGSMLSIPSGSGFLDAHPLPTSILSGNHIPAALMAVILRLVCNLLAASGGGRFSTVGVLVFTLWEGTPVIHHLIPILVSISHIYFYKGKQTTLAACYGRLAPWGLLWGASLCTGLSARVAVSCIGWLGYFMAAVLDPILSVPIVTAPQMLLCAFAVHLLGWECFFHSGLQTTIPSLDWNAAFVGVPSYNMAICGMLSVCRTAFPHIAVSTMVFSRMGRRVETQTRRHLINRYVLLQSIAVAFSCCACGVHMIHLMMWAIFCPKALFDAAIWAVTITQGATVQYLLL